MTILYLMFPDGSRVSITSSRVLGREDFRGFASEQDMNLVSREQLRVTEQTGLFWVEDGVDGKWSANGTTLNGQDLRGQRPMPMRDGDTVGVAGVLSLKVHIA